MTPSGLQMIADKNTTPDPDQTSVSEAPRQTASRHVKGLDTLRVILASWVVLGHFGLPIHPASAAIRGVLGNLFNGSFAVLAFFVISGFCIHLPYSRGRRLSLPSYFLRREVRILLPLAVVYLLGWALNSYTFVWGLWSIVCEEIYYTLYPALLALRRRYGWTPIVSASVAASLALLLLISDKSTVHSGGYGLTWLLLFPIWLMGCVLAEQVETIQAWSRGKGGIWAVRIAVWALSSFLSVVHFHAGVSVMYMALPFGLVLFYWIRCEVSYSQNNAPKTVLESLGQGSYTIYLTHMLAPAIALLLGLAVRPAWITASNVRITDATTMNWFSTIAITIGLSFAFYLLVERPSHRLAKAAGRRFESRNSR